MGNHFCVGLRVTACPFFSLIEIKEYSAAFQALLCGCVLSKSKATGGCFCNEELRCCGFVPVFVYITQVVAPNVNVANHCCELLFCFPCFIGPEYVRYRRDKIDKSEHEEEEFEMTRVPAKPIAHEPLLIV